MDVLGVSLGQAKKIAGALDQEGEASTRLGTLARVVGRARAGRG